MIRTENYFEIEEDLAQLFKKESMELYDFLSGLNRKYGNGLYTDWDKIQEEIEKYIKLNAELDEVNEICIYHLARCFEEPKVLKPLNIVLTEHNFLTDYLKQNNIMFEESEAQLHLYYKEELITRENMLSRGNFHLLCRRLGNGNEADFCINGFAIWVDIEKTSDGYYTSLQRGPEIMENLERLLGIPLLVNFRKLTKYYGIVLKVPFKEVIIDGREFDNDEDKALLYVKKLVMTLYDCYFSSPSSSNNLMIRFEDNASLKVDRCILLEEKDN